MTAQFAEARTRFASSSSERLTVALAEYSLPIVTACAFALLLVALFPHVFTTDGWLALVAGRQIADHGLPHTNTLTLTGHGHAWVDQQWLAQLLLYGFHALGGVRLVIAVNFLLLVAAYAVATALGCRRGGSTVTVAMVAAVALLPTVLASAAVRTQSFAYILFVGTLAVLIQRTIALRRALVLLAVLALWANLHGSVVLAAALVAMRGLFGVIEDRRSSTSWLLLLGPVPCLLASPYGPDLISYYRSTVFNSSFGHYLQQWAPSTLSTLTVPLYVLLLGLVWLIGRARGVYTRFEVAVIVVLVAAGLAATRNWPFVTLPAIVLAPAGLEAIRSRPRQSHRSNVAAAIAALGILVTALAAVTSLARPDGAFTRPFPTRAAEITAAVARANPHATIYASVVFADWLLWKRPELAGRLYFDARYELVTPSFLERLVLFRHGANVMRDLGPNRILVLDPRSEKKGVDAVRGSVRVLYDAPKAFIGIRPLN